MDNEDRLNLLTVAGVLLLQVLSSGLDWTAASQVKLFHAGLWTKYFPQKTYP